MFEKTVIWIRFLIGEISFKKLFNCFLQILGLAVIVPSLFLKLQFYVKEKLKPIKLYYKIQT